MKVIIALLTFAFSFLASETTQARSMANALRSELYSIQYPAKTFDKGEVKINFTTRKVEVVLTENKNPCPPNVYCVRGPLTHKIAGDIVSQEKGRCGSVIYVAKTVDLARLPLGAPTVEMRVIDWSRPTCNLRFAAPTMVETVETYLRSGNYETKKGNFLGTNFLPTRL